MDIEKGKIKCFEEIKTIESKLVQNIEKYGSESIVVSKTYNMLIGMKTIFWIAFGQDCTELKYFVGGKNEKRNYYQ